MMEGFHKFDLQTLGEMKFIFEQILKTGNIPVEQKDKARFYARYCGQLQTRIRDRMKKENIEVGQYDASSSHL